MKQLLYIFFITIIMSGCSHDTAQILSPNQSVISHQQNCLLVADETANQISCIDINNKKVIQQIKLDAKPGGLVLSKDESKLFVTISAPEGKLLEIDLKSGTIAREVKTGHTPVAPIIDASGKNLYLCNRFDNTISKINLNTFKVELTCAADREPVAASLSEKNNVLLVANHLPSGRSNAQYHSSKVTLYDPLKLEILKQISLPNGSNALHQITISPDEQFAYITHILARYNVPTNQVERGWINTNALSIIDLSQKQLLCTVMLDDLDLGAANPYDVKCSSDGKQLFVSHTGTNQLSIINRIQLHERIKNITAQNQKTLYANSLKSIQDDLGFLQDIRTHVKLNGSGAKGMAILNNKVLVSMYFSGTIAQVDLNNHNAVQQISLGKQAAPSQERLGEMYFNDATLCKQHWQSCASCHPGKGRVDGLNWDLLNDGIGNPKNTKSLLLAHATPPSMVTGIREKAEAAVRAGIQHILFTHQPEEIGNALDAYLKSLKPVPSPYLKNGQLSEAAKRGKQIFEKAYCAECHSGPHYTNLKSYDVGEGTGLEMGRKFDTPSLTEIWRTAPYLYDGKAKTVKEVLTKYNKEQKHGMTGELSEQELNDLAEYCLSL